MRHQFSLLCYVIAVGFGCVSCRERTEGDARIHLPIAQETPEDSKDNRVETYEAEVTSDTSSVDYTGDFCSLKKGQRFLFLDFSSDGEQFIRFRLKEPIEGCGSKLFLTMDTTKVTWVNRPTAKDDPLEKAQDVVFKEADDYFDVNQGTWQPVYPPQFTIPPHNSPLPAPPQSSPPSMMSRIKSFIFPLLKKPRFSYKSYGREFGALRSWGRLHAGVDLLSDAGSEVRAVADGVILHYYEFYEGTYALEVDHYNFVVRYGEVFVRNHHKKSGKVLSGESIAEVGRMYSGSSMLHFEMYKGTVSGPLTQGRNRPFQRRKDLVNPTKFIQELEGRLAGSSP